MRRKATETRGFTLIEILVSLVVLSLALGLLMRIFSSGMTNARIAEDYATATALAESLLTSVGAVGPLEARQAEGEFDGRFRWLLDVSPYEVAVEEGGEGEDEEETDLAAYQVSVTVAWQAGREPRSVSLTSLRVVASE